jgi:uncharacterized iron-regulated membrane protein
MDISVANSFIMAAGIVVVLAAFIGIVLWMNRRPDSDTPELPESPPGLHAGTDGSDPRSAPPEETALTPRGRGDRTR